MNHGVYDEIVTTPLTRYLELYCGIEFDPSAAASPRGPAPFIASSAKNYLAPAAYPNIYLVGLTVDREGSQIMTWH